MRIAVVSVFPQIIEAWKSCGIIKKGIEHQHIQFQLLNLLDFGSGKYNKIDDTPYGGGAGMVIGFEPLRRAYEQSLDFFSAKPWCVLMSPVGFKLDFRHLQHTASVQQDLLIICGRYEGLDQRFIDKYVDISICVADVVVSGGEVAAIFYLDALLRLIPGFLGNEQSLEEESFTSQLLEYPHYTKPRNIDGLEVPEILLSGNHKEIQAWREEQRLAATKKYRPDFLKDL